MRKAISIKLRFEVFKRDDFKCVYCGRSPGDSILLQVDHVLPVSKGGDNAIENLVTSCNECNLGKSAGLITSKHAKQNISRVTQGMKESLEKKKELERQLTEYYKYQKKLNSFDPTEKYINKVLRKEFGFELTITGMTPFVKLYNKLSNQDFLDSVSITKKKFLQNTGGLRDESESHFKYLCGVMNNKYKASVDPYFNQEREVKIYYLQHPKKRGGDWYLSYKVRPYIESLGIDMVKRAIDVLFEEPEDMLVPGNYFKSLMELLELWENV